MRCRNCPAYWEDVTYGVGVEDWGCYCNPKARDDAACKEWANGDVGCWRKPESIAKVMKRVEKEKEEENRLIAEYHKGFVEFCEQEGIA